MRTLAIIPARGGSKRIKDKNIIDFHGKPLITYSLDAALKSNLFDVIHVSTDSKKIKLVADSFIKNSCFFRSEELSRDDVGIIPVLRWVIKEYIQKGEIFENICMLFPTAPLITALDLIDAYKIFQRENRKYPVVAVTKYPVPVEWAYELEANSRMLLRKFPNNLTKIQSQGFTQSFYDAGSFAFFEATQLMDETFDIGANLIGYELPRHRSVDIDTPEDLEFAKILYKLNQ